MNDRLVACIDQLYRAHAPACLGYARALCGREVGEAEDIVHDVFVKLFHQSDPPAGEQARGYLLASVRNAAANRRRPPQTPSGATGRTGTDVHPAGRTAGWDGPGRIPRPGEMSSLKPQLVE
ncbi:MAG: sigma-70 family RNA polymerase sigma factor [Planctomycetes bacterium]|nr:sigma-70 family RNA polymerase sigma factor [Planctomycetota bacterium]